MLPQDELQFMYVGNYPLPTYMTSPCGSMNYELPTMLLLQPLLLALPSLHPSTFFTLVYIDLHVILIMQVHVAWSIPSILCDILVNSVT